MDVPEIPADILETAKEIRHKFWASRFAPNEINLLARAILAERERCAQIADAQIGEPVAWKIAKAIRS